MQNKANKNQRPLKQNPRFITSGKPSSSSSTIKKPIANLKFKQPKQESPKNIHDKINYINKLYEQISTSIEKATKHPPRFDASIDSLLQAENKSLNYISQSIICDDVHPHKKTAQFDNIMIETDNQYSLDQVEYKDSVRECDFFVRPSKLPSQHLPMTELKIYEMYHDLEGRIHLNKKSKERQYQSQTQDSQRRRPHEVYEKMLQTIERRLDEVKSRSHTPPRIREQAKEYVTPERSLITFKNSFQNLQYQQSDEESRRSHKSPFKFRVNQSDFSSQKKSNYFRPELYNTEERINKYSVHLNKTLNQGNDRERDRSLSGK